MTHICLYYLETNFIWSYIGIPCSSERTGFTTEKITRSNHKTSKTQIAKLSIKQNNIVYEVLPLHTAIIVNTDLCEAILGLSCKCGEYADKGYMQQL